MVTKRTGRPRGRPKRIELFKKAPKKRGRPKIALINDPDRYAVAALPVIKQVFRVPERCAAEIAAYFMFSSNAPETIRSKSRAEWIDFDEVDFELEYRKIFPDYRNFNPAIKINKTDNEQWIINTALAIYVAINYHSFEKMTCLREIAHLIDLRIERRFAEKCLVPLLHDNTKITEFMKILANASPDF
jgi:hypothetical protein